MSVVGQKRLHGLRSAGDENDFRIQVVFGEELQLGKRQQRSLKTGNTAVRHDYVFVGVRCAGQQKNDRSDGKSAAEKSIPHGHVSSSEDIECDFHNHHGLSRSLSLLNFPKVSLHADVALTPHRGSVIRLLCPRGKSNQRYLKFGNEEKIGKTCLPQRRKDAKGTGRGPSSRANARDLRKISPPWSNGPQLHGVEMTPSVTLRLGGINFPGVVLFNISKVGI